MQTFLTSWNLKDNAKRLDQSRLGKQRVETFQIMKALLTGKGWIHHPATKMWAGSEWWLLQYNVAMCNEWTSRGFVDNTLDSSVALWTEFCKSPEPEDIFPAWWGDERVTSSHRSNLLRKAPEFYGRFGWVEPDDMEYFWPTKEGY